MKKTLLIMAAGIGSRFGEGIKQLEPVGENDELIIDYSIHDAIKVGFNKVVIVIRKEIEQDFLDRIGTRIQKICDKNNVELHYAFQDPYDLPEGFSLPEGRTKPWGTGQAVLSARKLIDEKFVIINADDYYGKEAFQSLYNFLEEEHQENEFAIAGFILKNTLSDNGVVTRGICEVNEESYLTDVKETSNIEKTETGAKTGDEVLDVNSYVSMNMWALTPEFMKTLEEGFVEFLGHLSNPLKDEYLIPVFIGQLLEDKKVSVKVLETKDKWFGVTYKEDKEYVVNEFKKLISAGVYSHNLYGDLED